MIFQAGEAYFISDDSPINNFEFFRPLVSPACVLNVSTCGSQDDRTKQLSWRHEMWYISQEASTGALL